MKTFCGLVLLLMALPVMSAVISFEDSDDGSKLTGNITSLSFGYTIPTSGYSTPPNSTGAYCSTGYSRYAQVRSSEDTMTLTSDTVDDTATVSVIFANTGTTCVTPYIGTSVGIVDSAGSSTIYSTNSLKVGFVNSGTAARYGRLMYSTTSTSNYTDFTGRSSVNDITLESGKWYKLIGYFKKSSIADTWTVTVRLMNMTDNVLVEQITQGGITQSSTYDATSLSPGLSWNRSSALYSEDFTWSVEQCVYTSGLISFEDSGDGLKLTGNVTNLSFGYTIPTSGYSTPPNSTGAYCSTGYSRYAQVRSSEGTMTLTPDTAYDTAMVSVIFANTNTTCVTTYIGTSVGIVDSAGASTIYSTNSLKVGFVNSGTTARYGRLMYSSTGTSNYTDFAGRSLANDITLESGKWYKLVGYFRKSSIADTWMVTARLVNMTDNEVVDEVMQEGITQSSVYDAISLSAGLSWNRSSALYSEDLIWAIEQSHFSSNYAEIVVDTDFSDWDNIPGIFDFIYDGSSYSADLAEVKISNDESSLYYNIRTHFEFEGTSSLADCSLLYLDIDNDPTTGALVGPSGQQIGAEYTIYSFRRLGASMGNGLVLEGGFLPGDTLAIVDTFVSTSGLAPWDIESGVYQLEARVLLDAIGVDPGDTITYTVGICRSNTSPSVDWLKAAYRYKVALEKIAVEPSPANKTKCGSGEVKLSWDAPLDVTSPYYYVYIGTDYEDVFTADTNSYEYMNSTYNQYYNATLTNDTKYYWRIDVIDGNSVYKGKVWSFKTAIPAFPTAEGAGMWSAGGRGGDVYHVTNLNDTGTGSLRYGIANATGPRTIVFDISGTIQLESNLIVDTPNMTIAGQTAPGEGITLKKSRFCISKGDVIVRYLRSRPGDLIGECADAEWIDSITIWGRYGGTIRNIIVDHFSGSWSVGKAVNVIYAVTDCTIQYSTAFEALNDSVNPDGMHSMGFLYRPSINSRMTFHHNVMAHNNARNPRPGAYDGYRCLLDFKNNVIFNYGNQWAGYSGAGEDTQMNYVGNYVISGNDSISGYVFRAFDSVYTAIYQSSDYLDYNKNSSFDGTDYGWGAFYGSAYIQATTEFPMLQCSVTTETATNALSNVLENSGCTLPSRDSVDSRILKDINAGTGSIIDSQSDVAGWPTLSSLTAPADYDQDGMSDYWENQYGLNYNNSNDRNGDNDGDGYTNLEEYLNNTDPVADGSPIVYISVDDSRGKEGDSSNTGKFIVTRTGSTSTVLTVYITITGTASNGTDYATIGTSVTIPNGSSSTTLTITPLEDVSSEGEEQVIISIAANTNYKIGLPSKALVVIMDND